jgi:hypothetical protein
MNYTLAGANQSLGLNQGNNSLEPQARPPQIATQLEILQKELECNRDALNRLGERLGPVLSLVSPQTPNQSPSVQNEPTCPIANVVWKMSRDIAAITNGVNELMQRLEV